MTSVASMTREFCAQCGEKTVHGPEGCIHVKHHADFVSAPIVAVAPKPTPAERYGRHYPEPLKGIELTRLRGSVDRAVRALSPLQVTIAELFCQGMNSREIAAHLNIKQTKVNNQMQRARDLLKAPSRAGVLAHVLALKTQTT